MPKRKRATVLLIRDNRILLVRERGQRRYGLLGGGIEKDEPSLLAAVREVYEETRLSLRSIEYVDDVEGSVSRHYVFLAHGYGQVRLQRKELSEHKWWDRQEAVPMHGHVRGALRLVEGLTHYRS